MGDADSLEPWLDEGLLTAVTFRKKMLELANEYGRMHAVLNGIGAASKDTPLQHIGKIQVTVPDACKDTSADQHILDLGDVPPQMHASTDPWHAYSNGDSASAGLQGGGNQSPVEDQDGVGPTTPMSISGMQASCPEEKFDDARPGWSRRNATLSHMRDSMVIMPERPGVYLAASRMFLRCMGMVILLNVLFMGIVAEVGMHDAKAGKFESDRRSLQICELAFSAIYLVELIIRLRAFGSTMFYRQSDRLWNIFDLALVVQGCWDAGNMFGDSSYSMANLSFLRVIRFVKALKALRVIRLMRSFRELRLIVVSVLGSARSLAWSLVMQVAVCYIFALIIVQGVVDALRQETDIDDDVWREDVMDRWGSINKAMLTLFMAITGGIDWNTVFDPLGGLGPIFPWVFLLYIVWVIFVMANVITAVVVEYAIAHGNRDIMHMVQSQMEKKEEYEESLRLLFMEMDSNGDGEVSLDEFISKAGNPELLAFLESLEIEVGEAEPFFFMLSDGGRMCVTLEQFVTGCIRLRGQGLQALEIHEIKARHARSQIMLSRMAAVQEDHGRLVRDIVARLDAHRASVTGLEVDVRRVLELIISPPPGWTKTGL